MLYLTALVALAAQAIAVPQAAPPAPVSGGSGQVTNVIVGQGGPTYTSANLTGINNGDTIVFHFVGDIQHSVTQSTFDSPCSPAPNGFNSGLLGSDNQFSLTITDASKPIWFYCQQTVPAKHCGLGMVGSINAPIDPSGNTFDKFLAAAKALGDTEPDQTPTSVLSAAVATGTIQPASASSVSGGATGSTSSSPSSSGSASTTVGYNIPGASGTGSTGGTIATSSTGGAAPASSSTAPANNNNGGNNAAGAVGLSMSGLITSLVAVVVPLAL